MPRPWVTFSEETAGSSIALGGLGRRLGHATRDADGLADLLLDLLRHRRILAEELARVVLALADLLALVGVPGAGLLDDAVVDAHLDDLTLARDALVVEDVEVRRLERGRDLVLHDLHAGLVADHLFAALDRADAADVDAHRGVELERVAAGGGLGIAEHDPDLHADLVDEDDERVGAPDVGGELPQRLAHEARLQSHLRLAHLALDLRFRRERRDRIDHDAIDGSRAHQHVDDLERLLAVVGLREEELRRIDAQALRILGVERVLGVDEGGGAAELLDVGDDLQRERGLAGRFRPVDLDHAPARQPAHAERHVEAERAGGDDLDALFDIGIAQLHDRALAELLLDLGKRGRQGLRLVFVHFGGFGVAAGGDDFEHVNLSHLNMFVGHVFEASRSQAHGMSYRVRRASPAMTPKISSRPRGRITG